MKYFLGVIAVGTVLGVVAFFGYSPFIKMVQYAGSSAGASFNTARFAGVVANLSTAGANATSSSVYNGDSSDRYITAIRLGCNGVGTSKTAYTGTGLSALTVSVATSSTAAPATNGNTNLVGGLAVTIGTSTANFVEASSTSASTVPNVGSNSVANIWAAGSYLTFTTNATNTAACTFGVDYIGS